MSRSDDGPPALPPDPGRGGLSRRAVVAIGVAVAVIAAGIAIALVSRSPKKRAATPTTSSTSTSTTTTLPKGPVPRAPLTGLPQLSAAARRRCSVAVKVGNTAAGRPQLGVDQADVVYEEVVDAGITRLVAVFQSQAPARVGPVRSVRPTDRTILWPLRGTFAYSGGNPMEVASLGDTPGPLLDETAAGPLMVRDYSREAPNNLYARVVEMYKHCATPAPRPLFRYRPLKAKAPGTPATQVVVGFSPPYAATWTWDRAKRVWNRTVFGGPDITATRTRVTAANVVVMTVPYAGGPNADDGEGILTGSGPVAVFSGGKVVRGTWVRPLLQDAAKLLDSKGHPITLAQGKTWVELPDTSYAITVH